MVITLSNLTTLLVFVYALLAGNFSTYEFNASLEAFNELKLITTSAISIDESVVT